MPVPMDRFRPNIVVGGTRAYEEDAWRDIRLGGASFRCVKPCSRCKVPSIDQATAEEGLEPSATLAAFRTGAALGFQSATPGKSWHGAVFMGQNVTCANVASAGAVLALGDAVTVLLSCNEGSQMS